MVEELVDLKATPMPARLLSTPKGQEEGEGSYLPQHQLLNLRKGRSRRRKGRWSFWSFSLM